MGPLAVGAAGALKREELTPPSLPGAGPAKSDVAGPEPACAPNPDVGSVLVFIPKADVDGGVALDPKPLKTEPVLG